MAKSVLRIARLLRRTQPAGQRFSHFSRNDCNFGLLFDIDGVILRGKEVLPGAKATFDLLTGDDGRFRVPTVFVTNAGNVLRATKAKQLSDLLDIEVLPDQVLMSHSPLRMFKQFHDKHVLVSGQGLVLDIAHMLGFSRVTTIDDLRHVFPNLDCVDHKRRQNAFLPTTEFTERAPHGHGFSHRAQPSSFSPIEAVVLFGEPIRWETYLQAFLGYSPTVLWCVYRVRSSIGCKDGTVVDWSLIDPSSYWIAVLRSLQLLLDVLLTNGHPGLGNRGTAPYPHIPILACNIDLLWVSEAPLPRLGHGTFMMCLESLYKKLTGHDLKYTALMGKPSELTYHHAEYCIKEQAIALGLHPPRRIYAIGDNPESDILGANLFNQFLEQRRLAKEGQQILKLQQATAATNRRPISTSYDLDYLDVDDECFQDTGAEQCLSVLVSTGVYSDKCKMNGIVDLNCHFGNDMTKNILRTPVFVEQDIQSAVNMIFDREDLD